MNHSERNAPNSERVRKLSLSSRVALLIREEMVLWLGFCAAAVFLTIGIPWVVSPSGPVAAAGVFGILFILMLALSFRVVHHAECLAGKLGEPYGTLILTLSVILIEVAMICALMLTGKDDPTLARDTMFSVLMIVLNGILGVTLLVGGYRHRQQEFNLEGARSYLAVIMTLSFLCLILPRFVDSAPGGAASPLVYGFLAIASVVLYGIFLFLQSTRHRIFFVQPGGDEEETGAHGHESPHSSFYHAAFLILTLLPIVLLSKKVALLLDYGLVILKAPVGLAGFAVALLVLSAEALAAFKAAYKNSLQRTVNIVLGSSLSTIGLTVPAVLLISKLTGKPIELGLEPTEIVLLVATFFAAGTIFGGKRTNMLAGVIHLILFAAYVVLIFD